MTGQEGSRGRQSELMRKLIEQAKAADARRLTNEEFTRIVTTEWKLR